MPINHNELLQAAEMVAEIHEMKVSIKCSTLGAGTAAMTTFIGGLLAGPIGLFIGGAGGGFVSYMMSKDKFKPLLTIIKDELTPAQRAQLAEHISKALRDLDITDFIQLVALIQGNHLAVTLIRNALEAYTKNDLNLPLV